MHTIEVHGIPESLLQRLDERARASGSDRSQIIQAILAKELESEELESEELEPHDEMPDLPGKGFDAALAPIRQGFAESGLSEEEAVALLEEGLRTVRRERRSTTDGTPMMSMSSIWLSRREHPIS